MKTFKRTVAPLMIALLLATAVTAQKGAPKPKLPPKPKKPIHIEEEASAELKVVKKTMFVCHRCRIASMSAGKCPECKQKLGAANAVPAFACEDRHSVVSVPGKCELCEKPLVLIAKAYVCERCKSLAGAAGACKCGSVRHAWTAKIVTPLPLGKGA